MNKAVKNVNIALEATEFSRSTQAAYQYFYDELCDVFIENSKSVLANGSVEEQYSVQQTLCQTLDVALRMLHPFMPFITEELWQRLPRRDFQRSNPIQSIMLAPYPEYDSTLDFASEAQDFELGLQCAQGIRSLAADYSIGSGGRAFIKPSISPLQ